MPGAAGCELIMGLLDFFRSKPSLADLARDIERMLLEVVPAAVAKVKAKGPFYCLLLCYCAEDFQAGWPPFLLLGSEAERRRVIERGDKIAYYLWAPDEMRNQQGNVEIPLHKDKILTDACARHTALMEAKRDYASALKILKRVCKSLNQYDWSQTIKVTPDFLVAAVDNTGEVDPSKDIEAVIPLARFQALREQGLI
jgi:hypothetical protein